MKVKIGIIGLGKAWERLHSPAYARLQDKFEITAVCDHDLNIAQSVAQSLGLAQSAAYSDYKSMLKSANFEAVDTMAPIHENYECAKAVIKSGFHLIAEKPFASTVKAAKELIRLKEQMGVKVMVAENFRYDEENVMIKSLINENRIGEVMYFIDNHVIDFRRDMQTDSFASAQWRKHPSFKGGIFLDSGVHHIARHRFLFGRVSKLFAGGRPTDVDFIPFSCITALCSFENNIMGHYTFCAMGAETQSPLVGLRIFGTEGEIYLENKECGYVNISYRDGRHEALSYAPGQGYYHELNNFYDALRHNAEIISTPEKELGDIEVIFSILDSIGKERAIKPDDRFTRTSPAVHVPEKREAV